MGILRQLCVLHVTVCCQVYPSRCRQAPLLRLRKPARQRHLATESEPMFHILPLLFVYTFSFSWKNTTLPLDFNVIDIVLPWMARLSVQFTTRHICHVLC